MKAITVNVRIWKRKIWSGRGKNYRTYETVTEASQAQKDRGRCIKIKWK